MDGDWSSLSDPRTRYRQGACGDDGIQNHRAIVDQGDVGARCVNRAHQNVQRVVDVYLATCRERRVATDIQEVARCLADGTGGGDLQKDGRIATNQHQITLGINNQLLATEEGVTSECVGGIIQRNKPGGVQGGRAGESVAATNDVKARINVCGALDDVVGEDRGQTGRHRQIAVDT